MNKELYYQVKAAQKLLTKEGFTCRLATMQEKRALARDWKKRNYLPCSYGRPERKALRDVYDNFKKDVWVAFSKIGDCQFWSSRKLIKVGSSYGRFRSAASLSLKYIEKRKNNKWKNCSLILTEPPLEDSEFYAGGTRELRYEAHSCSNCPESVDWAEYKAQNGLTNE